MAGTKHVPPLLQDEVNRFRNKATADVTLTHVLRTVLDWGCKKKPKETYLAYLKNEIPAKQWGKYSKRWSADELNQLNEKDCSSYDVTFLFKLIPEVCSGIAPYGSPVYIQDDDTKIECLLQRAKNFRNEDAHDPTAVTSSSSTLDEVEDLSCRILTLAGTLFGIKPKALQQELGRFGKTATNVKKATMTDKQKTLEKTRKKVCEQGKKEFEVTVMKQSTQRLPFTNVDIPRSEIFHPTTLFVEREEQMPEVTVVSCDELLSPLNDNTIVIGHPGSGKSTLLRRLLEDFVSAKTKTFKYLDEFDLLLFMECRDTSAETIPQLFRKNFPKTLKGIDDETAVDSIKTLKVLIVIDGIDELNEHSSRLLNELIDTFGAHSKSTFIFASRPGAAEVLIRTLRGKGMVHSTAIIQPISSEKEQIEFLSRYQTHVPGINTSELIDVFKALEEPCKNCMVHPVYLSLFCHLFHSSPEEVGKWKNELGIIEQTLELSLDFIKKRLYVEGVKNEIEQNHLASKLLDSLRDMTVRQLLKGTLTIDQRTYIDLCSYCFGDLDVSYYTILSCVLEGQSDHITLEYYHKSFAEFLAAKAILERINIDPMASLLVTIPRIVEDYTASVRNSRGRRAAPRAPADAGRAEEVRLSAVEACRYENCFRFVIMMLLEAGPDKHDLFKRCLEEICHSLTEGSMPFSYWAELCLSCLTSQDVIAAAAEAAGTVALSGTEPNERDWFANNPRYMRAAAAMVSLCQPPSLSVYTPESEEPPPAALEPLLLTLGEHFSGELSLDLGHTFRSYTPVDDLMTHLQPSLCAIVGFKGCVITGSLAWRVFRAGVQRALDARIVPVAVLSIQEPRLHELDFMHNTAHMLDVRVKTRSSDTDRHHRPLPMSTYRPPQVTVTCSGDGDQEAVRVAAIFEDLAPEDKQYKAIWVQHWRGGDSNLTSLVDTLTRTGLHTPHSGLPRWTPSSLNRDGSCNTCSGSSHRPGGRCVVIYLPEKDLRNPDRRVQVNTLEDAATIMRQLPFLQLEWLDVVTLKGQEAVPALAPLLEAARVHFRGSIDLRLDHSYFNHVPVDDDLIPLSSAECSLVEFRACLRGDSEPAWRALMAAVLRAQSAGMKPNLGINLLDPRHHLLHQLQGTAHQLVIYKRLQSSSTLRCHRPLPSSPICPPALIVDCAPPEGAHQPLNLQAIAEQAEALIQDLAPETRRYLVLQLQNWPGTDEGLDKLVKDLSAARVMTQHTGTAVWVSSGINGDEDCNTCDRKSHEPGQRCVVLRLP